MAMQGTNALRFTDGFTERLYRRLLLEQQERKIGATRATGWPLQKMEGGLVQEIALELNRN